MRHSLEEKKFYYFFFLVFVMYIFFWLNKNCIKKRDGSFSYHALCLDNRQLGYGFHGHHLQLHPNPGHQVTEELCALYGPLLVVLVQLPPHVHQRAGALGEGQCRALSGEGLDVWKAGCYSNRTELVKANIRRAFSKPGGWEGYDDEEWRSL